MAVPVESHAPALVVPLDAVAEVLSFVNRPTISEVGRQNSPPSQKTALPLMMLRRWRRFLGLYQEARQLGYTRLNAFFAARARL